MKRQLLATLIALALAAPAGAQEFSGTVFFGDSLTDAGTFGARFTTNPGSVWSELISARLGATAVPAIAGGDNFAVGGARVTSLPGIPPTPPTDAAPPIATQITSFLTLNGGAANPSSLYTVWGGANDIFFATGLGAGAPAYVVQTADELAVQIGRLQAAGARFIIVPNLPDIGATPFGVSQGPAGAAALTQLSAAYNQALHAGIGARGLRVVAADTFGLLTEVLADPGAYGFVNASTPACGATPSLLCTPADLVAPGADQSFVFADGVHPTTATHAVLAEYMGSIIAAPTQISMLAETALQSRARHIEQLFARARHATDRGLWVSADGRYAKVNGGGFAGAADGWGAGIAAGADYAPAPGWIVGAALAYGEPEFDFAGGGSYRQAETALSVYGGWSDARRYLNAVLTYGELHHDVHRAIRLGTATRIARGEPGGRAVSLGLEAGAHYTFGRVTHGPVGGLVLQQVKVDAFTEQGGGSAGMRYGAQTRDSALARLGWQMEYDAARWRPYARLTLDHELRDDERLAEAQVATAAGVPLFAVPAATPGRTFATLAAGTALRVSDTWNARFGLATTLGQDDARSSAVFATLAARL